MKRYTLLLSADVRDSRIHEGAARYFHTAPAITDILLKEVLPWDKSLGDAQWSGALLQVWKPHLERQVRAALRRSAMPAVLLSHVDRCNCPQVLEDNCQAGRLAAEYFLSKKFTRFAVAAQGVDIGYPRRIQGFVDTLASSGFSARRIIYQDYFHDNTVPGPKLGWGPFLLQNIRDEAKPLAILALDDKIGCSVLRHCAAAGIRIPEEVVVLGIGNEHVLCEYAFPPLSSVDMNLGQIGWKAAQLLHRLMEGAKPPATPLIIPPLGIIERRSTEILSSDNPLVMEALRHLWDHLAKPVMPADVARAMGLSRPYLDRLFLASFGRTVKQELTRARMQRIREMLTTTSASAKEIASAVGFRTLAHMSRIFAQEHKITLRQFRALHGASDPHPWEKPRHATRRVVRSAGGSSRRKRGPPRKGAAPLRRRATPRRR